MDDNSSSENPINESKPVKVAQIEDDMLAQADKLFQTGVVLIYGERKAIDKAIKCIQRAITYNDSDYRYWRLLGEAYYQRGSFNPAINCFVKSIELAESETIQNSHDDRERRIQSCTFSRLRMSDIRLAVGHLEEAVAGYSEIILKQPKNVAALVGLAKTQLQLSKDALLSSLGELDQSHCMDALRHSLRAIDAAPRLCITLKTASDCCLTQFLHGPKDHYTFTLDDIPIRGSRETIVIDRRRCVELAQQFICRAIAIEPFSKSSCLWHNLGVAIYLKSTIIDDIDDKKNALKKALFCLLKAIDFDRGNSQIRNSIAVIAYDLGLICTAQSFFIKSIQANMSTSEVQFSNLGYCYLKEGEYRLAGVAFSRCQAEEPLYSRSWPGNVIINSQRNIDSLTEKKNCHGSTVKCRSHIVYSKHVFDSGNHTELIEDLRSALYCMRRYIHYVPPNGDSINTIGLLCKRCNYEHSTYVIFE